METVLISAGQAGGKLASALRPFDQQTGFGVVPGAVAVNTAKADFRSSPVETMLIGQDRVNGHGIDGGNELGAAVMESDQTEVTPVPDGRVAAEAESTLVVTDLGGGSGSDSAPVPAEVLVGVYDMSVYVLGILSRADEGALYQMNAGWSLKAVAHEADAVLLADSDALRSTGESVSKGYDTIDEAIAHRVGLFLTADEAIEGVGENAVDTSEAVNTLRSGGIVALGYANAETSPNAEGNINAVMSTTRRVVLTGTSLLGTSGTDVALVIIAGEPNTIPRKGVERARRWVEDETGSVQVRGSDLPLESGRLASLVLLGNVERSERIKSFVKHAHKAIDKAKTEP